MAPFSFAASPSSSSVIPKWNYHVFLSFRDEDTRKTFTSHLYEGLDRIGIYTFQDNKRLEEGSTISVEICKAIEESQVAVIIFSKNYAGSGWCLDELVKIMECKNELGQTVIPVFYDVDPSTVRYQMESFGKAFAEHESRYDDVEGKHKVQRWRTALTEVAGLKGHDIRNRIEAECIKQIVDQISSQVCKVPLSSLQDVVGINFHLEKVKPLLKIEISDVRFVGIWGMGGVGKTTIARAIFDNLCDKFKASCFLADDKENERRHGMHSLQNILLSELLRNKSQNVNNKDDGKHMLSSRLCSKKVLVVLDDIDHRDHLNFLAGDRSWFGKGSKIFVTTRDKHLIGNVDVVYEVTTLPDHEAIQLFNRHAFKDEVLDRCFETLSREVVNYAKGLPLALVVWGSFLNNNRDIHQWKSVVKRMKDCSNSEIVEKLKISYDGLETQEQEIFLDIACFFRGHRKDDVVQILESCSFQAIIGLQVLIEKSLVFISGACIEMHDLIQDMGKYVVNVQKDPGERSRVWQVKDFEKVMINNTGTKAMEAIRICVPPDFQLSKKAMKNMNNLRLLHIKQSKDRHMTCSGGSIKYLSNNLCWFIWDYYPSESLPANFEPERLVHLELAYSKLRQLWTGQKALPKLRKIILRCSTQLEQTPDFTMIPNLEILDLNGCTSLTEVHHSLGDCRNLTELDLRDCYKLIALPSSISKLQKLVKLHMRGCHKLIAFPSSICKLQKLVKLNVSFCRNLESLPEEIGDMENLKELHAKCTLISRPPSSIVRLNKLKHLSFAKHQSTLFLKPLPSFVFPRVNEGLRSLEELDLDYCNLMDGGLPDDIGCLSSLQLLRLRGNKFDRLPRSIAQLCSLQVLDLALCKRLKELPELPQNIVTLRAHYRLAPEKYSKYRYS